MELLQPRLRGRAGDDEHPHLVLPGAEDESGGEQREAKLAAGAVRVRDRGDPAVQREREPAADAQVRQVPDERRRDERRAFGRLTQQLASDLVDDRLVVELPRDVQRATGLPTSPRNLPVPANCGPQAPVPKSASCRASERSALRERRRVGSLDLADVHVRMVRRRRSASRCPSSPTARRSRARRRSSGGCPPS